MAICDTEVKTQVKVLTGFKEWDRKLDTLVILKEIKKIVYTSSNDNQNIKHRKAITLGNLMELQQEKHQDIRDFRDQYQAIRKVCTELGLRIGRCNDDAMAILESEGITKPTKEQLKGTLDRAEEELHAIIFLYKTNKHQYGRFIENAQNDVLQKKPDPFKNKLPIHAGY